MESVRYVETSGRELSLTIELMVKAIEGTENHIVMMAGLAVAILSQVPDIEATKLVSLIKGMSEYMSLNLVTDMKVN